MQESAQDKPKQSSTDEERPKETPVKESIGQADQSKPQAGQILEESTQSIASMTKDMQETAKIVSQMKKELEEKRVRIADIIASGKPFSDSFATTANPDITMIANARGDITDFKTEVQPDQRFHSNQLYELLSTKIDMVIEQNKEILKLLNSKADNDIVFP